MENLIPVVNKLHDVFTAVGERGPVDLPQIVVVGSQSAGKSSVLESIVGRSFLPRGHGIVTRRPLILQLTHTAEGTQEQAVFLHQKGRVYTDWDEVRREIEADTARVAGANKGISRAPISLHISSPHVVDLTLVDLPGITRNPIGDQPRDIERQIREMVAEYVTPKNAIILAVSPANVDISNSDAIAIARDVDPRGERTIGVVTKCDIMDHGTDAYDILTGQVIPLRLGFIGVVCRGEAASRSNVSLRDAQKAEKNFFASHPRYSAIASRCGIPYLATKLNQLLVAHIQKTLPALREKLTRLLDSTSAEYRKLCPDYLMDAEPSPAAIEEHQRQIVHNTVRSFSRDFSDVMTGQGSVAKDRIAGGARLRLIFEQAFPAEIKAITLEQEISVRELRIIMENAAGMHQTLFIPESAFISISRRLIECLREPCLNCIEQTTTIISEIISDVVVTEARRFPALQEAMRQMVMRFMEEKKKLALEMVRNLIRIELAYINTSHPDFIGRDQKRISQLFLKYAREAEDKPTRESAPPAQTAASTNPFSTESPFKCPVCDKTFKNNRDLNTHLDTCLKRQEAQQEPAKPAKESQGIWNIFGGKQGGNPQPQAQPSRNYYGAPDKKEKRKYAEPEPVPQRPPKYTEQTVMDTGMTPGQEEMKISIVTDLINSYFDIVKKNLADTVPKTAIYYLVNETIENIYEFLYSSVARMPQEKISELVAEPPEIVEARKNCKQRLETLRKSVSVLSELNSITAQGAGEYYHY